MKDRIVPCIYYTCAHAECQKHYKDVTLSKCQHCEKYKPRKTNHHPEPFRHKRQKDKDRHENWKKDY